ncbi:ABC transporter permease [Nocardioides sp. GXZ039]|uniref:ABC transporter permease n=1 Tax=Nocardioides sp. GXZ039 TaxID=3136018 RepID=UPI0030F40162
MTTTTRNLKPPSMVDTRPLRHRLGPGKRIPFNVLIGPALLLIVWSVASAFGWIDPYTLVAPWKVVTTGWELIESGRLQSALAVSAARALTSLAIGVLVGTVLALIAGMSRIGEGVVDGIIQVKRSIPTMALIPLFIVWFGIGESMKAITISAAVLVPVYLNTYAGLRGIDSRHLELAETLGISRREFAWRVLLPGAMPGVFVGLRYAVTIALVGLVVVEQINVTNGIGFMMANASMLGQTDVIIVGLVVYAMIGLLADGVVRTLERRVLRWRKTVG